jgi:signal transduction histidine kinase
MNRTGDILKTAPRTQADEQRPDRRLLAGYLHKTSNSLCGIKGYASLIADRDEPGDQVGHWARKIIREVERMEEIFRSVGNLSHGKGDPDTGMDLAGFLRESALSWVRGRSDVNLRIEDLPRGEPRLPAADLALVMKETLDNSAQSGAQQGQPVNVEVSGEVDKHGRIFLVVSDDGCGMEHDLAEEAPKPFVTTKEGHHGVGLTRVDTLMDMYGLAWTLASEAGVGTRVRFEVGEVV